MVDCVYVVKFSNQKDKVKLGFSTNINARLNVLKQTHGQVEKLKIFEGKQAKYVEKVLHQKFLKDNIRIGGDGGTEFFLDVVQDEAERFCRDCGLVEVNHYAKQTKKPTKKKAKKVSDLYFPCPSYPTYNTNDRPVYHLHLRKHEKCVVKYRGCEFVYHRTGDSEVSLAWVFNSCRCWRHFNINETKDVDDLRMLCNIVTYWNDRL